MIAAITFWALTGGGTLASAVYLIHQYCDDIGVWRYRRESAAERPHPEPAAFVEWKAASMSIQHDGHSHTEAEYIRAHGAPTFDDGPYDEAEELAAFDDGGPGNPIGHSDP